MTHVVLVTKNDRTGGVSIREGVLLGETMTSIEHQMKDAPADCRRWAVIAPTRAEALRAADVWVRQAEPRVPRVDVPGQPGWLPPGNATAAPDFTITASANPPDHDLVFRPAITTGKQLDAVVRADRRADIATKMMATLICEPEWGGQNQMLVGRINGENSPGKIQDRLAFAAVALADALIRELEAKP